MNWQELIKNPVVSAVLAFALGGGAGTAISDGVSVGEFAEHKTASTFIHEKTDVRLSLLEQQRAADLERFKHDDERYAAILAALKEIRDEIKDSNKRNGR